MPYLSFSNGDQMPSLGLGTWKSKPGEVYEAVLEAIRAGYRHIDCAPVYENEPEVGEALHKAFTDGLVKREDLWVTSKLWNNSHHPADVLPALEGTLSDLQLDYLDLYLIHWPIAFRRGVFFPKEQGDWLTLEDRPLIETWGSMEEAKQQGKARHIGVSNFSRKKIADLIQQAHQKPEADQVEMHPYLQHKELFDYCQSQGIQMTAYSPLGSRDRTHRDQDEPNLMEDPTIKAMAESKGFTPAQILLAWHVNRGASVIPKSVNPKRIRENLAAADIVLSADEMDTLAGLDRHFRFLDGKVWTLKGSPYTLAGLWDE